MIAALWGAWLASLAPADTPTTDTMWLLPARVVAMRDTAFLYRLESPSALMWPTGEALEYFAPLVVRRYSITGLAAFSFRGTKSDHSEIRWNDAILNSPMNGTPDVAILRNPLFDGALINAAYGTMGAVIAPYLRAAERPSVTAGLRRVLSYDATTAYVAGVWPRKKAVHHLRAYGQGGAFDYPYPTAGAHARLRHNATMEGGLLHQSDWQGAHGRWRVFQWHQRRRYEVASPPTVSYQPRTMDVRHSLVGAAMRRDLPFGAYRFHQSLTRYFLHYRDSVAGLSDTSVAWRIRQVHTFRHDGGAMRWAVNVPMEYQYGRHRAYGAGRGRLWAGPRMEVSRTWRARWETALWWRPQWTAGRFLVPMPSMAAAYRWAGGSVRLAYRSEYKLPNFNDLYWRPGGNPDLLPEYTRWLLLDVTGQWRDKMRWRLSAFGGRSRDWIMWVPRGGDWYVENVGTVRIRGVEAYGRWTTGKWMTETAGQWQQVRRGGSSYQLIFVPMWQGHAQVQYRGRCGWARAGIRAAGRRYTTTDNSAWMAPYGWIGLWGGFHWKRNGWHLELMGGVENVMDVRYETTPGMPMPGRTFSCGLVVRKNALE